MTPFARRSRSADRAPRRDGRSCPPDATLFRIKEQPQTLIVRSDLVERLRKAGVGGFELLELDTPVMI